MTWSLDDLLPHRAPMVLIDGVEAVGPVARALTARVSITPDHVLYSTALRGVPNWAAIEFMAQAAAALAGCIDKERDPSQPARPGLLLGTRRLDLRTDSFAAGRTYSVNVISAFWDDETASFACTVADDSGTVVAEAVLNAYRPKDFAKFLTEQANT